MHRAKDGLPQGRVPGIGPGRGSRTAAPGRWDQRHRALHGRAWSNSLVRNRETEPLLFTFTWRYRV